MLVCRAPHPLLRPFVELLWASDPEPSGAAPARERMLPSASAHLVIRLGGGPLRLYADSNDGAGDFVSHAVVCGLRETAYLKDGADPAPTVGVLFRPGNAGAFLGAPGGSFAGCHTPLDAFWGGEAERLRTQLGEEPSLERRLALIENVLLQRLPRIRGVDPAILRAALLLDRRHPVGAVAETLNCSHRHFIARFSETMGLTPKRFARLARFGRMLRRLERHPETAWAELALDAGYADQAHFNRDFRAFAGISPGEYRKRGGAGRHVPDRRR